MNSRQKRVDAKPTHTKNGCRIGAEYAIGISPQDTICVAEITKHRPCAGHVIRSQWADNYAIAMILPIIESEFRPNDFDARSGARLMTGCSMSSVDKMVGKQTPLMVPKTIFESSLKKLGHKEVVFPSIRSIGRNAGLVRRDVKCALPVVIPSM